MSVVVSIFRLFTHGGNAAYFGEAVTQTEHALQTAHLAEIAGASDSLVVAALLHDLGHLLHGLPETIAEQRVDARHENGGAAWLARYFGPAVVEPIGLHVAAKRYLCAVEPTYFDQLSPASRKSLELQGGPFASADVRAFECRPYYADAVALRRWDDQAKVPGLDVPGLKHYRQRIEDALVTPRS
jgi:[1-hydroxy-2-(trimethylamino)ethyl]phosphonate dioxygenase